MTRIHEAYAVEKEGVQPGEIHGHAANFIKSIPAGDSIVALPVSFGLLEENCDYVYDPDWLIEGRRFFKVLDPSWGVSEYRWAAE